MATKFLDKTGLSHFWSKIKAWCNSLFALDSTVVHKTGNELVQGIKEFKNAYDDTPDSSMPDSSHSIVVRTTRYRKGSNTSSLNYADFTNIIFQDNEGTLINHDGRLASIDYAIHPNGVYYLDFICFKNKISEPDNYVNFRIGYLSETTKFATINTTLQSNVDFIANNNYFIKRPDITKGTIPASNQYMYLRFCDKDGIKWQDNGLGLIETYVGADGFVRTSISACKNEVNSIAEARVQAVYDSTNDDAYGVAPTPSNAADSSSKIATTEWVRTATGNTTLNAASASKLGSQSVGNGGQPIYLNAGVPTACSFKAYGSFSDVTKGINPSANKWLHSWIYSDSTNSGESSRLVEQRSRVWPNGATSFELVAYDFRSGYANGAVLSIVNNNGVKYAIAPTPALTANTDAIATTEWVRTATGDTTLNAATASAFNSAKSIALTGIVTGTASGTNGWTIATKPRMCRRYGGANGETRYFKVASGSLGLVWNMLDVVFLVQDYIHHSQIGLWHVRLANGPTAGVIYDVTNQFILNANIESVDDFYLCYKNGENGNPAQYELYVAFTGASKGLGFIVLSEMERSQEKTASSLTLYNTSDSDYVSSLPSGFTALAATNATVANSISGNAGTATKLATARNLQVALNSTTAVTFDGSANQNSIPVSGVLPIANGGTGSSTKNFVDLTSGQTVSGMKTFSENVIIRSEWPHFSSFINDYTYGSALPSVNRYAGLLIYDKVNKIMGAAEYFLMPAGDALINTFVVGINQNVSTGVSVQHTHDNVRLFRPNGDNLLKLGNSVNRWKEIWSASAAIQTSDERLKLDIESIPSSVLEAWDELDFKQFKFVESVNEKGNDKARLHTGLIAQDIDKIFKKYNLNANEYGLFCYDQWEDSPAEYAGNDEVLVCEAKKAGDRYSLRYEEALCVEAAYQRYKNKILEDRISELEKRLAKLEGIA